MTHTPETAAPQIDSFFRRLFLVRVSYKSETGQSKIIVAYDGKIITAVMLGNVDEKKI